MILPPRTRNKEHFFQNTNSFGVDDKQEWSNGSCAVLKHNYNKVKLFIDASMDTEIQKWRFSQIKFDKIQIINNHIVTLSTEENHFAKYFNENDTVKAKLEFENTGRLITYKNSTGVRRTLTKYDGSERDDLPDNYKGRFSNYEFWSGRLRVDINQFSQWGSANYKSVTFTNNSQRIGVRSDLIDLEIKLLDTNDEGIENAPVYFYVDSGVNHSLYHADGDYSLTDAQGIARCSVELKEEGLSNIIAQVDSPAEISSIPFEIQTVDEEVEIYIRGITFQTKHFVNDYNGFYSHLETIFKSIPNLSWQEMAFNQANIVDSGNNAYEQLVVFLKRASFNFKCYLTEEDAGTLRTAIINKLNADPDILYQDVELRTYRKFVNI